jgi:hypothetical protein
MFKRPHHQKIASVLKSMNVDLLTKAECYFAGGTAITLQINEYRESVDIDFICSSKEGYKLLRNSISHDLGNILTKPIKHIRDVRIEREKFSTFLDIEGTPIKIEFLAEGNTSISGAMNTDLGVPTLSRTDMFAQKLMANADRGGDKATLSRDIVDLSFMIREWGHIPLESWSKAYESYGDYLINGFFTGIQLIQNKPYLESCLSKMKTDKLQMNLIYDSLYEASAFPHQSSSVKKEMQRRIDFLLHTNAFISENELLFSELARSALKKNDYPVNWAKVEIDFLNARCQDREQGTHKNDMFNTLISLSPAAIHQKRHAIIQSFVERYTEENHHILPRRSRRTP